MAEDTPRLTFINDPNAPDFYCTAASGFFIFNGNLMITLESARVDHDKTPVAINRVVIGRVVMSVPAAQKLVLELYDFLKQRGLDPKELVKTNLPIQ